MVGLESLKSIKLNGGIFGRVALTCIFLVTGVSWVCRGANNVWLIFVLMIFMMSIVFYLLKRCLDFAESNPQAAIMDGAELLQHDRLVREATRQGPVTQLSPSIDNSKPVLDAIADVDEDDVSAISEAAEDGK